MGWIIAGILLFAVYAVFTLSLASLGVAMGGDRTATAWSVLGLWLILMAVPVWGPIVWPINRLGYQVPVLGAPFPLGGRGRQAGARTVWRR